MVRHSSRSCPCCCVTCLDLLLLLLLLLLSSCSSGLLTTCFGAALCAGLGVPPCKYVVLLLFMGLRMLPSLPLTACLSMSGSTAVLATSCEELLRLSASKQRLAAVRLRALSSLRGMKRPALGRSFS